MEILLIRHGKTKGNLEGRYIGRTDEPLLESSREDLQQSPYRDFEPDVIYVSPMRRCRETAEILFSDRNCEWNTKKNRTNRDKGTSDRKISGEMIVEQDLREMDFGDFENKNYEELKDESFYQAWIDAGGKFAFPGGEDPMEFRMRCRNAFENDVRDARQRGAGRVAFVVHGGTIMSIMEEYGRPKGDFYRWQVKNGEGYRCVAEGVGEEIIIYEK